MALDVLSIGTALPKTHVSQEDALTIAQTLLGPEGEDREWLGKVYAGCGIGKRHFSVNNQVVRDILEGTNESNSPFLPREHMPAGPTTKERMDHYEEFAGPLALSATTQALGDAEIDPTTIRQLVTVSCTGFFSPGVDQHIIREVPLSSGIERTHVGFMGCHGALNGLRAAHGLANLYPGQPVLLVAGEHCSLHNHYLWEKEKLVANALFGDGAAALVMRQTPGHPNVPSTGLRLAGSASCIVPNSTDLMSWRVGDNGFTMTLSPRIPALVRRILPGWITAFLAEHGLTPSEVKGWAVHPGGPRILDAVEEAMGLGQNGLEDSRAILAEVGNISSPTVLFILQRMLRRQQQMPIVALGFGPGIAIEAALFR